MRRFTKNLKNLISQKLSAVLILGGILFSFAAEAQKQDYSVYTEGELQTIEVPVGGIAAGNLLMGGRGNIEHIEIFNRPDRQRRLEKTFFSLWVKQDKQQPQVTLLEREILPPYEDVTHAYAWGLPRMDEATFINHYPRLEWQFRDKAIPLEISLEVINPIVPLDFRASNIPASKFSWTIKNTTTRKVEASIALSMENPLQAQEIASSYFSGSAMEGVRFTASGEDVPVNFSGGMIIAAPAGDVDIQTHWFPGTWRDETHIFWNDFSNDGRIESKKENWTTIYKPASYNESTHRMATVLVPFSLEPGEEIKVPFYLAWYFPERQFGKGEVFGIEEAAGKIFRNSYASRFTDEADVLGQFVNSEKETNRKALAFAGIINNASLPGYVKEALTTQIATLASPLIQVTEKGEVHGFEGVLDNGWCCAGTCTHVWNYEQTLASLFPSLERKMREIEFLHNTFDDGFQTHRSVVPLGNYWFNGPAAADGQMGSIVRAYRDWRLSGDMEWLARLWPRIKLALEFAWYGSGEATKDKTGNVQEAWDPNRTGLLSGRQHNTYDIDFYGPSSMTTSIYLAALKAGSEMAGAMGESELADTYRKVYEKGSRRMVDSLWNGEYFIQIIADEPELYSEEKLSPPDSQGRLIPKYQYGNGCLADQLLGQYLAFISGLGYIAPENQINQALQSVYRYNFRESLKDFSNVQRVYGLNDEAGVILCTWPKGDSPLLPFVYAQEIWTGVEYQVAASLIYGGMVDEGLHIVKAVQNRYDGAKRNPFGHIESGIQYARALASWSLLLAISGVQYNGINKEFTFAPKINNNDFSTFWSSGSAWGEISIAGNKVRLEVVSGILNLRKISIESPDGKLLKEMEYGKEMTVAEGESLVLEL